MIRELEKVVKAEVSQPRGQMLRRRRSVFSCCINHAPFSPTLLIMRWTSISVRVLSILFLLGSSKHETLAGPNKKCRHYLCPGLPRERGSPPNHNAGNAGPEMLFCSRPRLMGRRDWRDRSSNSIHQECSFLAQVWGTFLATPSGKFGLSVREVSLRLSVS